MSFLQQPATRKTTGRRHLLFERLMAIAATINLGLVLFDFSYIPWRNFYLRKIPSLTQVYDPVKGIELHRDTQEYLNTAKSLQEQVSQTGLQSPQAETWLAELRRQSVEMIQNNPFAAANKSGTLEKIKNRMRERIYQKSFRGKKSATQAFTIFWSQAHLSEYGWQREINFFNQQIQPLIETNYYRHVGENGEFIDQFWIIDLPFILLFSLEFLARTWTISRRHQGLSWKDAMLWRWYDIFLLLPFWRWLRVISVTIRLNQANLINLDSVQQQINRSVVVNLAGELTEVIILRVINHIQAAIQAGELNRWLFHRNNHRFYSNVNDVNEVEGIANLLLQLTLYQVIPKIQPDLEAIVRHNITTVFNQSPISRACQNLPGVENLISQLVTQLATEVTQNTYKAVVSAVEDPVAAKLSSQLLQHFSAALESEVQQKQTLQKIQGLLVNMLEEIKLKYVKSLTTEDVEQIVKETQQLGAVVSSDKRLRG